MKRIKVLDIGFDNVTMEEAIEKCKEFIKSDTGNLIVTPNPEIVMRAKDDENFKNIINSAELVIPDGIGIIKAGNILGTPLKERVAGYDLICNLLELYKNGDATFYFWGSKPEYAKEAKELLEKKYSNIKILGTHNGYFKPEEEQEIIDEIRNLKPDILLVGTGAPKQEMLINKYKSEGFFKIGIGCGGSIDVLAGRVKRAPKLFIKLHLEWFYRLLKEPTRFKRMLVLPQFIKEVKKSKTSIL